MAYLFAAAATLQAAPLPPNIVNPGFARRTGGDAVTGWVKVGTAYRFDLVGGAGHLAPGADAPVDTVGSIWQSIDARPWRGRLVRFSVRVRLARPGGSAALVMSVVRPPPKPAGFNASFAERPIVSERWQRHEVVGRVAANAERINILIVARDRAELLADDASLEEAAPNPSPPSAAAAAYLDEAIRLIREGHIDSVNADWPRIIANARAEIGGAVTTQDTYWAILGVIGELGERHTLFRPARPATAPGAPPPPQRASPMPESRLVAGRLGLVRLPWHIASTEEGLNYRDALREQLTALDRGGVCGWIVDLRGNGGGNMWPMMNGLDPLLGDAPFGQFVNARREVTYWGRGHGVIYPAPAIGRDPPAFALRGAVLPAAVLIDGQTMSSGEMIAIAFVGRPASRSFGAPSGGYTTGNRVIPLSDGTALILTGSFIRDRAGRDHDGPITPDEVVDPAQAEAAAARWLSAQPSCAH